MSVFGQLTMVTISSLIIIIKAIESTAVIVTLTTAATQVGTKADT